MKKYLFLMIMISFNSFSFESVETLNFKKINDSCLDIGVFISNQKTRVCIGDKVIDPTRNETGTILDIDLSKKLADRKKSIEFLVKNNKGEIFTAKDYEIFLTSNECIHKSKSDLTCIKQGDRIFSINDGNEYEIIGSSIPNFTKNYKDILVQDILEKKYKTMNMYEIVRSVQLTKENTVTAIGRCRESMSKISYNRLKNCAIRELAKEAKQQCSKINKINPDEIIIKLDHVKVDIICSKNHRAIGSSDKYCHASAEINCIRSIK